MNRGFSAEEIRTFILPSVLEGLKAIHDLGIIHKDLKPGNMMISDDESHIVLIDFGISSVADSSTMVVTQTGKSPFYSAPETTTGLFWTGSDYYSLGISLYELYTGTTPYQNAGIDNIALYAQAQRIPYPDDFDAELKDLIDGLTYKDISNRNDPGNPNRRWEYKEVSAWLNGEKPPVPGQNVEEPSNESVIPYTFKDRKYYSVPEITEAFLNSWEDGKKEVFRGFLTRYFELTDNREALNLTIKAENEAVSSDANLTDALFFNLMYELNPDIKNFIFKGYSFTGIKEFAENIEKLLTTDNPLIASVRYLILNDCFEVLIKQDPEYSVQKNYLYVVKDLVNTYLDTFSDNDTGSYGNDSDNNKYIALVFTNSLLKHNKILVKNELFDNVGEFLNYLQQKNTADQMDFIRYRNANIYNLNKAMFFIPADKKEEFKKLLPWLLPEEESDALYPVHFDNYYFKSHSEACSFLNGLKNGDIRLTDTNGSHKKASAENRLPCINNFKIKYKNFLKKHPPAMEEQMEIKRQCGIIINSFIPDDISAGDTIFFGRYENRPIKWQVLQADEYNNRALLMSEKIITRRQYGTHVNNSRLIIVIIAFVIFFIFIYSQISLNQLLAFFTQVFQNILNEFNEDGPRVLLSLLVFIGFCTLTFRSLFPVFYDIYTNFVYNDISWSNSKIREWLNSEFLNDAFDRNELQYIIDNTVSPTILNVEISKAKRKQEINFQYEDKVFLLGEDELEYFSKIITIQDPGEIKISDDDNTAYWLSYPVYDNFPRVADKYGKISHRSWRRASGVRPAIWVHM